MVALLIVSWIAVVGIGCLAFDKLMQLQYTRFRRSWEKDGRPFGIFWVPPEVKRSGFWAFIGSSSAHKRAKFDWLFITPAWVKESAEARAWLYAYRVLFLVSLPPVGAPHNNSFDRSPDASGYFSLNSVRRRLVDVAPPGQLCRKAVTLSTVN